MAGSPVQSATDRQSGDATQTVSLTGVAAGATLVLKGGSYQSTAATSCSGGGATWTKRASALNGSILSEIWIGHNSSGGSVTVTWTLSAAVDGATILEEWSGLGTTDPYDVAAQATGSSTSPDSGATATLAQADAVKLTAMAHGGGNISMDPRAGDGDTEVPGQGNGDTGMVVGGAYKVLSATTAVNGRWTLGSSQDWAACVVVLKATGGGGDPPTVRRYSLPLTGVG